MIQKDKINLLVHKLHNRLIVEGNVVQSISFTGTAAEVVISLVVNNLMDQYVVTSYEDGTIDWLRSISNQEYYYEVRKYGR
jgi:hypothetical protein